MGFAFTAIANLSQAQSQQDAFATLEQLCCGLWRRGAPWLQFSNQPTNQPLLPTGATSFAWR